jgi:ribonuclease BN (tRNA processing enzyme)
MHLTGVRTQLLVDCGASTLIAAKYLGIELNDIDAVVLSHLHGDHFGGLPFMILDGQFRRRTKDLVVAGPPGTPARVIQAMEVLFPGSSTAPRRFEVSFTELVPGTSTNVIDTMVSAFEVDHSCGAPPLALRLDYGGKTVAYSGDTAWTDELLQVASEADVFICEAYSWDRQVRYHLDFATLTAHRQRIRCDRIVLTHMGPDMLSAAVPEGYVTAHDGMVVDL